MNSLVKRRKSHCILLISSMAVITTIIAVIEQETKERRHKRRYRQPLIMRRALLYPKVFSSPTAWRKLLFCGGNRDFIIAVNFTKDRIIDKTMESFDKEREKCTYGSPYRTGPNVVWRRPTVASIDLFGLSLWYLKSSGSMRQPFSKINWIINPCTWSVGKRVSFWYFYLGWIRRLSRHTNIASG